MTNGNSDLMSLLAQAANTYMNAHQQGNYDQIPQDQAYNHYQQAVQQLPPDQVYQAHQQYYQEVPQNQRQGILQGIVQAMRNKGENPQQAGIDPDDDSPENVAKANQYVAQKPDLLHSIFQPGGILNSPLAKVAMVGALAYLGRNMLQKK